MEDFTDIEFDDLLNDKDILENETEVSEVIKSIQDIETPNTIIINNTHRLKVLSDKQKDFFISKLEEFSAEEEKYHYNEVLEKM